MCVRVKMLSKLREEKWGGKKGSWNFLCDFFSAHKPAPVLFCWFARSVKCCTKWGGGFFNNDTFLGWVDLELKVP